MSFWRKEQEEKIDVLEQLQTELEEETAKDIPESEEELSLVERLALEAEAENLREKRESDSEISELPEVFQPENEHAEAEQPEIEESQIEEGKSEDADFNETEPERTSLESIGSEQIETEQIGSDLPESPQTEPDQTNIDRADREQEKTDQKEEGTEESKHSISILVAKIKSIPIKWIKVVGGFLMIAGIVLILWGVQGHHQTVSGDEEAETEAVKPAHEMGIMAASYTPDIQLDGDMDGETHISYQAMKDSLRGWICEFGRINIRNKADFEGEVVDYVVYGDQISVYEQEGEFTRIKYVSPISGEELEGYCFTEYISETEPEGSQVYLNVPLYKQADHRWGAVKIGGYETLASAGCTTTCISMVESYMTGQDVYPDDVVDMLYYTYDGRLVFPDYYTHHWARDYMSVAVKKLHEGIPVLVSGYNSAGGTHWVVLVAYKGDGEDFSSDLFTINDPGSPRYTLTDFMRDYPFIEKIVYYNK